MALEVELAVPKEEKQKTRRVGLPRPIPKIRELSRETFKAGLSATFDQLDEALFRRADRAGSNNEQIKFLDTMRELRVVRRKTEAAFLSQMDAKYVEMRSPAKEKTSEENPSTTNLALVEKEDFEVTVAFTRMVARARGSLTAELFSITMRLDSLFRHEIDRHNNPLDPEQICAAFGAATENLKVDVECRLVFLNKFEANVLVPLRALLVTVEDVLIQAGVSPKAKIKRRAPARRTAADDNNTKADFNASIAKRAPEFFTGKAGVAAAQHKLGEEQVDGEAETVPVNQSIYGAPPILDSSMAVLGSYGLGASAQAQGSVSVPSVSAHPAVGTNALAEGIPTVSHVHPTKGSLGSQGSAQAGGANQLGGVEAGEAAADQEHHSELNSNSPHVAGAYQSPHGTDNDEVFSLLRGLLSSKPDYGQQPILSSKGRSNSGPAYIVESEDLLSMLNTAQDDINPDSVPTLNADGRVEPIDLRGTLSSLLDNHASSDGRKARVSPFDEDVIDLVSMFFDFILDDPNLPTDVQALIGRLQIPLLRLAIRDRAFFNKPEHPARQLLNRLAREGVSLEEGAKGRQDISYRTISDVVSRILKDSDGSLDLFEELLEEFTEFQEKQELRSRRVEGRAQQIEVGKAKTEQARSLVSRMIDDRVTGKLADGPVKTFFAETWSQIMLHIGLKEGPESEKWYLAVEALDSLVWALIPRRDMKSRIRWAQILPETFGQICIGLEEIRMSRQSQVETIELIESALRKTLKDSFENKGYSLVADTEAKSLSIVVLSERIEQEAIAADQRVTEEDRGKSIAPDEEFDKLLEIESSIHDRNTSAPSAIDKQLEYEAKTLREYMDKIDEIDVGAWVLFKPSAHAPMRCKLSAKLNDQNTFIFVNRRGQKVFEQRKKLLAQELRRGRLEVIDTRPLFERALDVIVGRLGSKDAATSKSA